MKDAAVHALVTLSANGNSLSFDPGVGNLRTLILHDQGRAIQPLHTAHWVGDAVGDDLAPVEHWLSGDFFCAPFGAIGDPDLPPHGWPANSPWKVARTQSTLTAKLERLVQGARVTKTMTLAPDAPLLLQEHVIDGGTGPLTFAHHPMVKLAGGGRFAASAKRAVMTLLPVLEPEHGLVYPARATGLSSFPGVDGAVDLTRLPIATRAEDFVVLVEGRTSLGWSAVLREAEDDIVFFLKNPALMPVTMLWHSNGGRAYPPWDGRHTGVIGIEDGCAAGILPPALACQPNPVSDEGVSTCLELSESRHHRIAYVTGAIARPAGWTTVADIQIEGDRLTLTGDTGSKRSMAFPHNFLELEM